MVFLDRNSRRSRSVKLISSSCGAIALALSVPSSPQLLPQSASAHPQVIQNQKNALDSLPSQERAALTQGQATVSGSNGRYIGRVLINAPATAAWDVLTDYNNFDQFFPNVENSQLLESVGNRRVFEQTNVVRIFPLTRRNRIVIASTETYPRQIDFRLVEGDLDALQGNWRIDPVSSNQILITHQVLVDPAGSNATRNFVLNIYQQALRDTMGALKTEAEQRARR